MQRDPLYREPLFSNRETISFSFTICEQRLKKNFKSKQGSLHFEKFTVFRASAKIQIEDINIGIISIIARDIWQLICTSIRISVNGDQARSIR